MPIVYVGHPPSQYPDDCADLVGRCSRAPDGHGGAEIRAIAYERNFSLNVNALCARVKTTPGPVLLLENVQTKTVELVRQKLYRLVPIQVVAVAQIDDLTGALSQICQMHADGLPRVPIDLVVALLLMRKLDHEHRWTGNAKGYMWADDMPKGRGLDEKFSGRVPHVLNILQQHGLVVFKISKSKKKYALNPDRKADIFAALRTREFQDETQRVLFRNGNTVSVRELDLLADYDDEPGQES